MTPNFETAFQSFFAGCGKLNIHDNFRFVEGTRYMKVICETSGSASVHCFVDKKNGDVLLPHNWKAPAKHARGNIFDSKNGLGSMGEFGPAYLR